MRHLRPTDPGHCDKRKPAQAEALAAELKRELPVRCVSMGAARALCATDLSIYLRVPVGVVIAKNAEDVEATVAEGAVCPDPGSRLRYRFAPAGLQCCGPHRSWRSIRTDGLRVSSNQ